MARLRPTAEQYDAQEPARPVRSRQLLNLPPSPPFYLKFHPARWGVLGGSIRPILGRLPISPGVNGVKKDGGTEIAEAEAGARGWKILPWESIKLTHPERSTYVKMYQGRRGKVHLTFWETPRSVGSRVTIHSDTAGYHAWLDQLMAKGFISPPDPDILDAMVDAAKARVGRHSDTKSRPYKAAKARLEELEAAIAKLQKKKEEK